eukprot:scaffold12653_cov54-Phaeocystis_antarctica.AAC.1
MAMSTSPTGAKATAGASSTQRAVSIRYLNNYTSNYTSDVLLSLRACDSSFAPCSRQIETGV